MIFTDGPVVPGYGIVFGGPYKGFTAPSNPGETDKRLLVETHLNVFKVFTQVARLIIERDVSGTSYRSTKAESNIS